MAPSHVVRERAGDLVSGTRVAADVEVRKRALGASNQPTTGGPFANGRRCGYAREAGRSARTARDRSATVRSRNSATVADGGAAVALQQPEPRQEQ